MADLTPSARDTRVLQVMLLLRKAHQEFYPNSVLRVVGENALASTSVLALGPRHSDGGAKVNVPDFVNTQAINARALVMALAYPVMQPAVAQLFHRRPGAPQLHLAQVGREIIDEGRWTFAQVTRRVASSGEGNVCCGYVSATNEVVFAPDPESSHEYVAAEFLIVFERRARDPSALMGLGYSQRWSG